MVSMDFSGIFRFSSLKYLKAHQPSVEVEVGGALRLRVEANQPSVVVEGGGALRLRFEANDEKSLKRRLFYFFGLCP